MVGFGDAARLREFAADAAACFTLSVRVAGGVYQDEDALLTEARRRTEVFRTRAEAAERAKSASIRTALSKPQSHTGGADLRDMVASLLTEVAALRAQVEELTELVVESRPRDKQEEHGAQPCDQGGPPASPGGSGVWAATAACCVRGWPLAGCVRWVLADLRRRVFLLPLLSPLSLLTMASPQRLPRRLCEGLLGNGSCAAEMK